MKQLILAVTFLLAYAAGAQTSPSTDPFPRRISVTGSAETSVTPDEIYLSVTLKEYVRKGASKKELSALTDDFMAACKAAGIADSAITVSGIGGGNDYYYWTKTRRPETMLGEISYEVKLRSFEKVSTLADRMPDGANFNVSRISHSQASAFRKQLKIDAVKAAREKAIYLADAAGERVGQAIDIQEPEEAHASLSNQSFLTSQAVSNSFSEDAGVVSASTPSSRKIRYRYEVRVVFALK